MLQKKASMTNQWKSNNETCSVSLCAVGLSFPLPRNIKKLSSEMRANPQNTWRSYFSSRIVSHLASLTGGIGAPWQNPVEGRQEAHTKQKRWEIRIGDRRSDHGDKKRLLWVQDPIVSCASEEGKSWRAPIFPTFNCGAFWRGLCVYNFQSLRNRKEKLAI